MLKLYDALIEIIDRHRYLVIFDDRQFKACCPLAARRLCNRQSGGDAMKKTDAHRAADFEKIASASYFICSILSEGRWLRYQFPTLADARAFAPQIEQQTGNFRRAIIYAIGADNSATFVHASYGEKNNGQV